MAANLLTAEARLENVKALSLAAGISPDEATERLSGCILCTFDSADAAACQFYSEFAPILARTIDVNDEPVTEGSCLVEVIVGDANPRTTATPLYLSLHADGCTVSVERVLGHSAIVVHPLLALVAACYAAGVAIYRAVGKEIPNPPPDSLEIRYDDVVPDRTVLDEPIALGDAHLAGAGAIGNGFLWAARHINLHGRLTVCDDDVVSSGNLQRQIWFGQEDIGAEKSSTLCLKVQSHLPDCRLVPVVSRLQELPGRSGAWLERLIVAVDSRRARRELQNELPQEVFDASTTDIREIVLHYNNVHEDLACMGCLYRVDEKEISQDQVIADHLSVSLDEVRSSRISRSTALAITQRHPHLNVDAIEGQAFDSLYKELCGTGELQTAVGKQIVAPFAFVSVLAGTLLLLDVVHRIARPGRGNTNEWRVSPWRTPFRQGRHTRLRLDSCECCGKPLMRKLRSKLWKQPAAKRA
jgi:hypothetical protein